jgi:ribosomal protein L32
LKKKYKEKCEKAKVKREAKRSQQKAELAERRRYDPEMTPCSSCGRWDHSRRTSKDCPNYMPRRSVVSDLKQTSIIKASLESCCRNQTLKRLMQETVVSFRNFSYVASLFMEYLIVRRLAEGQEIPSINQSFIYNVFCQLIGRGSSAPRWVKDLWENFSEIIPSQLKQSYRIDTRMASVCAQEYQTNFVNHVVSNFARKTTEYFFIRFSDSSDLWHLDNVSVANKRLMASYAYKKAATLEAVWPKMRNVTIPQARIDQFATNEAINLGPLPVTDASLSAKPSNYLPWLFQVLRRLEQRVLIQEATPQDFVSKGFVHRRINEVGMSS